MWRKLSTRYFFLFFALLIQYSLAQDLNRTDSKDEATTTRDKVELPYQTMYFESFGGVLFDNGPIVTLPAGGCAGGDASILDGSVGGHTLYGWGHQQNLNNFIADDFTNPANWNIDSLKFFAYQTGAATSTITGVYVQIWDGDPTSGGVVVWGDQTTNRLQRTDITNIYRAQNTTPTNCDRRIQEVVATVDASLPPGTYWVEWGCTGSAASGPWVPPVTIQGVAVTGNAMQHLAGVWSPALNGTTSPNGAPFIVYGESGDPCPVQPASNPNPEDGAANVSINLSNLTWDNGTGTTAVEIYFGEVGNLQLVHDGAPLTSFAVPGPLDYSTAYGWQVVCKNDTCNGVPVATWSFTTEANPSIVTVFFDDFEDGAGDWTITNDGGTCIWEVFFPPYPNVYTLPAPADGGMLSADSDECGSGTTLLSTATVTNPIDATNYQTVWLEFDNDFRFLIATDSSLVEVSTDGGTTWTVVWSVIGADLRNTHEVVDLTSQVALTSFWLRFRSVQPDWDWWWTIDNVTVYVMDVIPVELTSFTASVIDGKVNLNWQTATETNNYGFDVERKTTGQEFTKVGFVGGYGTTTEVKNYIFADNSVTAGSYTYRLKQVDFDGSFEYSNEVEVDFAPASFSLAQNYPNPFNPATKIEFGLASDSKVTLKIFDILGQEVITLINGNMSAGLHRQDFDAASMNSGVYFYTIEAVGVDGTNFSSTRKMILTK